MGSLAAILLSLAVMGHNGDRAKLVASSTETIVRFGSRFT
jgi:hypothetical protein